jgi:hypothetical protein
MNTQSIELPIFDLELHQRNLGGWPANENDLIEIAQGYNPGQYPAHVVVDGKADSTAFGWVRALKAVKGSLLAVLEGFTPQVGNAIRAKSFKKYGVSFFQPGGARFGLKDVWFTGLELVDPVDKTPLPKANQAFSTNDKTVVPLAVAEVHFAMQEAVKDLRGDNPPEARFAAPIGPNEDIVRKALIEAVKNLGR